MYFEINIALDGKHLFATHQRSISNAADLIRVFKVLTEKFPKTEGFSMSVSHNPQIQYGADSLLLSEAIQTGDTGAVYKLFDPEKRPK